MTHNRMNVIFVLIVFIDYQKAFNSVSHRFLFDVLHKLNFGENFINWIKLFYRNISSCILNNQYTSQYFPIQRGVRQGDPLSPYLFIIVVEILANYIRQEKRIKGININNQEIKLVMYADDTTAVLNDTKSAKIFIDLVAQFGKCSGLKINTEKTEALWVGKDKINKSKPLGISWSLKPLKVLGIYIWA